MTHSIMYSCWILMVSFEWTCITAKGPPCLAKSLLSTPLLIIITLSLIPQSQSMLQFISLYQVVAIKQCLTKIQQLLQKSSKQYDSYSKQPEQNPCQNFCCPMMKRLFYWDLLHGACCPDLPQSHSSVTFTLRFSTIVACS